MLLPTQTAAIPSAQEPSQPPRSRRPLPALVVLLALASLALGLLSGCQRSDAEEAPREDGEQPSRIAVAAIPLARGEIESVLRFSANLEAEVAVEVYAEADRKVRALLVEEGDRVRRGQVLLRLEDAEQQSALAKVSSQLEKARREFERQRSLWERELISEQAWSEARYELEQLEIELLDAERELQYTEVRAPITGVVTARLVNIGDHVQVNAHLFDLVDFDSIVARVFVPEKELARLDVGQDARLLPQTGEQEYLAAVKRIAPIVDPRSGTVKVTLDVPGGHGLVPGMYVEVELVAETEDDALLVPKRALVWDQDQAYVYRVAGDERAERVRVRPQLEERDFVSVGEELALGDRVVVAGQAGLKNGARVRLLDLDEALQTFAGGATLEELAASAAR